ncbi:alpha-tocopherol transfer protein-like isoform X2 [Bacillus rossius redtenbacheri]|uniref:alpha-tocopherol transfer protein-like isoform X2 n=1 Tax=Bacillus rossius redtenbacheri TaxID=93214 RepID=UPI002FDCDA15
MEILKFQETCTEYLNLFDSNYLLRFLRTKKFSCPMAQEALERYLLLRQTYSPAFNNFDMKLKPMAELLDLGYMFAAPKRDKLGRRVIIARPGVFDPYKYTNVDMCRIHGITYETLMEDEENQVRGYVHFADGLGVGFPHLTLFTPREAVRIVKNGEKTLPMRHKEGHVINVPPPLKFAVDFGFTLVSEKIKKRIKIYTCLEDALEFLDRSVMPLEYGGTMPMAEMIGLWKEEVAAHQSTVLANDAQRVREELYSDQARQGAVSALKQPLDLLPAAHRCMVGSFRKLEVD